MERMCKSSHGQAANAAMRADRDLRYARQRAVRRRCERGYPCLNRPDLTPQTLNIIGCLSECPIVFEVCEELKRTTGFRCRPT
jgi:hypothetical protein